MRISLKSVHENILGGMFRHLGSSSRSFKQDLKPLESLRAFNNADVLEC
jgi:hypothetical protein